MSIMGNFLLLAVEASAELAGVTEEGGIALNTNILETNIINLAIIIFVLFYFGRKLVGASLAERRSRIETEVLEVEQSKQKASATLAEQQQRLAQTQAEAERIRREGQERAQLAQQAILAQATEDIQRLREAANQEQTSEAEKVMAELRQRVIALAIQRAEEQLKGQLRSSDQEQIVSRNIALLGSEA